MTTLEELLKSKLGSDTDITEFLSAAETEAQAFHENATTGLVANRDKLLGEVARLKKNQMPAGMDLEAYNTFLQEKDQLEAEKLKAEEDRLAAAGEWDVLKKSMLENHAKELASVNETFTNQVNGLQSALDKELIENAAIKAIEAEKGNSTLLLPHLRPHLKTVKTDTGYATQVVDAEGNQRINTSNGEAFGIKDLVAEFKANETFAGAFPAQNSGGGLNAGGSSNKFNGVANPWKKETKNITMQAKMMRENPSLAAQMKKAAGVNY